MRILVIAVLAYLLYKAYSDGRGSTVANDDTLETPTINPDLMQQPQQKFYVRPKEDPRVDGADQPWYVGTKEFLGSKSLDFLSVPDSDSISYYATKDFWTEISTKYSH